MAAQVALPPQHSEAMASAFDDAAHADVRLHIRVSAPSTPSTPAREDPGRSGQAANRRQGDQSDPAVQVPSSRSYYAHAVVLSSQSEYFKVTS
jgi:hypothetical protein